MMRRARLRRGWGRLLDSVRVFAPRLMACWDVGGGQGVAISHFKTCHYAYLSKLTMYNQIVAFRTEEMGLEPISSVSMYID